MTASLLDSVRRCAMAASERHGVACTPIPGLSALWATAPGQLQYVVSRPLVALVLQGSKRVTMGPQSFDFGAGQSLLITADVPTVSQVTGADARAPYYSLVLELDTAVIGELVQAMEASAPTGPQAPVRVDSTEAEVADAALRLMRLLERPASLPILDRSLLREMHYWLLAGRHGAAIRQLGVIGSHAQRIGRAVAAIRADYAQPLRIERLAEIAGMSPSSFHAHFRAVTSLTPLQFQKQLRLIEARRLMLAEGAMAKRAAHAVGYESITQFTREYGRLFGMPPARDMQAARTRAQAEA